MNDMTTAVESKTRTYYIESKSGGSPRLVRAKSVAAVREYLAEELWTEPKPARQGDYEHAMAQGCSKIEEA